MEITNLELIVKALSVLAPRRIGDYLIGDVSCALLTEDDSVFLGVCVDVISGIGFCAEHAAIAAMVTAGKHRIKKIVAVWKNENNEVYLLTPCGRCREFINQIHPENLNTEVVVDTDQVILLFELLPYRGWKKEIILAER